MSYFAWLFDFGVLPFVFIVLGIIIIGSDFITYQKRQKHLEKEISESKKRIEDPAYAQRLAEHGYQVPYEYLPKE